MSRYGAQTGFNCVTSVNKETPFREIRVQKFTPIFTDDFFLNLFYSPSSVRAVILNCGGFSNVFFTLHNSAERINAL
ncbi:MAG: hypothetical protein CNIPEHKO_00159 [Anaerolineales bacterium]|nr:hypothetical protein [Anaerolineales bacterium]